MEIDFNYACKSGYNISFYAFIKPKGLIDGIKGSEITLEYVKMIRYF